MAQVLPKNSNGITVIKNLKYRLTLRSVTFFHILKMFMSSINFQAAVVFLAVGWARHGSEICLSNKRNKNPVETVKEENKVNRC